MSDKADLQDGTLVVKEGAPSTYPVTSAVHFVKLVTGDDAHGLIGRVKTTEQILALGAEQMGDSVIMGDTAYEVSEGFVTEVQVAAVPKGDARKKPANPEADLLAAFILDKL